MALGMKEDGHTSMYLSTYLSPIFKRLYSPNFQFVVRKFGQLPKGRKILKNNYEVLITGAKIHLFGFFLREYEK